MRNEVKHFRKCQSKTQFLISWWLKDWIYGSSQLFKYEYSLIRFCLNTFFGQKLTNHSAKTTPCWLLCCLLCCHFTLVNITFPVCLSPMSCQFHDNLAEFLICHLVLSYWYIHWTLKFLFLRKLQKRRNIFLRAFSSTGIYPTLCVLLVTWSLMMSKQHWNISWNSWQWLARPICNRANKDLAVCGILWIYYYEQYS